LFAINNHGATLLKLERYAEAATVLSRAIEKDPGYGFAYFNRGSAYEMIKEFDKACADWNTAIGLGIDTAKPYVKDCN